jgi:hypothetical protein
MPTAIEGLETFSLSGDDQKSDTDENEKIDAESFFNLPDGGDDEDEEEDK